MKAALPLLALLAATLCGCSGPTGPAVVFDTIVARSITISNATDYSLVWVHNQRDAETTGMWGFSGPNGTALPEGWNASFQKATFTLEPKGSKRPAARGYVYGDWAWTMLTIRVPANQTPGSRNLELHFGDRHQTINVTVSTPFVPVAKVGSKITTHILGTKEANGEVFQPDADFPTTVGSGQTIPGFDFGHAGLARDEEVTLRLPPALGYGYDQGELAGQVLLFKVKIKAGA